jgi:hypothetical protein
VATELEKLRSHGTDAYCYYAKGFREWRLTMKSPSTKSDDPSILTCVLLMLHYSEKDKYRLHDYREEIF